MLLESLAPVEVHPSKRLAILVQQVHLESPIELFELLGTLQEVAQVE